MPDERFAELVGLACHDLRTPLATIGGFAKTLVRSDELAERDARFVGMIDEAAGQAHALVEALSLAARLAGGSYAPLLTTEDTLELAALAGDERVGAEGVGASLETDRALLSHALGGLAAAALRFGEIDAVAWRVDGRELVLSPVEDGAAPVLDGSAPRDRGALVARLAIESLGGSIAVEPGSLRVRL
jgi:signal transduction histidine kinase